MSRVVINGITYMDTQDSHQAPAYQETKQGNVITRVYPDGRMRIFTEDMPESARPVAKSPTARPIGFQPTPSGKTKAGMSKKGLIKLVRKLAGAVLVKGHENTEAYQMALSGRFGSRNDTVEQLKDLLAVYRQAS